MLALFNIKGQPKGKVCNMCGEMYVNEVNALQVLLVSTEPHSPCQTLITLLITLYETRSPNQISKINKHILLVGSLSTRCTHQHGCACHNDIWLAPYSGRLAADVETYVH